MNGVLFLHCKIKDNLSFIHTLPVLAFIAFTDISNSILISSEASIRGALCTITQLFLSIGISLMYTLGAVVHWREAALICLSIPIISMVLASIVVSVLLNICFDLIMTFVRELACTSRKQLLRVLFLILLHYKNITH